MQSSPLIKFSVLLPSWNRPTYLKSCLSSLISQDYSNLFEIVVVLRVEDTESQSVAEEVQETLTNANPQIIVVLVDKPGFVTALKAGYLAANNEIVSFCDDDAIYPSDWLTKLAEEFEDPHAGGVGGPIKEGGMWQGEVGPTEISSVDFFGKVTYGVRAEPNFNHSVQVASLPGANMAYRRNLLHESVFDSSLDGPSYSPGNEFIIGWSVRRQGYFLNYLPSCPVEHYSAAWVESSRTSSNGKAEQYGHNLAYAHARFAGGLKLTVYLLGSFLYGEGISPGLLRIIARKFQRKLPDRNGTAILKAKYNGFRRGLKLRKIDRRRLKNVGGSTLNPPDDFRRSKK